MEIFNNDIVDGLVNLPQPLPTSIEFYIQKVAFDPAKEISNKLPTLERILEELSNFAEIQSK